MAVKIELKRSAVPGKTPTTSSLELGELAINTYDGKLFLKQDVSGTESIIEIASTSGSVISASYANNAGNANTSTSSSYAFNSTSASYANNAGNTNTATSASYAFNSTSASYALTASYAINSGGGVGYNYIQTSSSNVWNITHNLNNQYPVVNVYNFDNTMILTMSISGSDINTTVITFSFNTTGYVRII
jgi:hypothetical protein